ncbi:VOC family protein [Algicella marina]|uniref:VOC family protein n=1 Tax=Algicella marina TaxID=2683284 RepID=A0A6P1T2X2_9RHOB|nr:VOC family protein [Algicella marina]QHQ35816.1 VOC family protein [Algicella marina]
MAPKVTTCIWFEKDGLEAARFYTSLLPDSEIRNAQKFEHMVTGEADGVQVIEFTLAGAPYSILQAGPHQQYNDMMSISVTTENQAETDRLWTALTADGGREIQCGWLRDRWSVAWQISPRPIVQLIETGDPARLSAMFKEMYKMKKIDIATLQKAYDSAS